MKVGNFIFNCLFYIGNNRTKLWLSRKRGVAIGDGCTIISKQFPFGSEPYLVKIGNNVRIANDVLFVTHDGAIHVLRNLQSNNIDLIKPISVGNNVFIGIRSIILSGVEIHNNVIIGAGSIVTKSVESNCVFAGVPGKKICSIYEYNEKHTHDFMPIKSLSAKKKKEYLLKTYN